MGKRKVSAFEKQCTTINNRLKKIPGKTTALKIYNRVYQAGLVYRNYRRRKVFYCSECGSEIGVQTQKECPVCHAKWTAKPVEYKALEVGYHMVMEAKGDIQLCRIYRVDRRTHYGKPTDSEVWEVERFFYAPTGERKVFARSVNNMTYYYDAFSWFSDLQLRREDKNISWSASLRYNLYIDSYTIKSFTKQWQYKDIPTLMKEFDNNTSALRVIAYPWAETMRKTGQEQLFRYMVNEKTLLPTGTAKALNICTRNHYVVSDPSLWLDTLYLLKHYRYDIHNAHYVCPVDLVGLHQTLFKRKQKEDERLRVIRRAAWERRREQERIRQNAAYAAMKAKQEKEEVKMKAHWAEHFAKILPLSLTSTDLTIRPLQSIDEFKEEGTAMHHCVYTMGYYDYNRHPTSLILSAKDNEGKRLATIEYNMQTKEIVQCRAAFNQVPERDKEIRALVNGNKVTFDKLLKAA